MKTIKDNPNPIAMNAFDPGLRLPMEATTVVNEITDAIVHPEVRVYSEKENEAIRKSQTY